jgi:hypothetical protein
MRCSGGESCKRHEGVEGGAAAQTQGSHTHLAYATYFLSRTLGRGSVHSSTHRCRLCGNTNHRHWHRKEVKMLAHWRQFPVTANSTAAQALACALCAPPQTGSWDWEEALHGHRRHLRRRRRRRRRAPRRRQGPGQRLRRRRCGPASRGRSASCPGRHPACATKGSNTHTHPREGGTRAAARGEGKHTLQAAA